MKKPLSIILFGGIIIGLLGAGGYLYVSKSSPAPDVTSVMPTPTPKVVSWDDSAGFSIQYPEKIKVNKHEEDTQNYAHVEFTDSNHPGGLTIWAKDIPKGITTTASWGKMMSTPSAALSFDTTLGGQPAQKIMVSTLPKMVYVGVVWDGVLWYVEANLSDEPYWQDLFDTVIASFQFTPLPTVPAGNTMNGSDSGDTSFDEEEILE